MPMHQLSHTQLDHLKEQVVRGQPVSIYISFISFPPMAYFLLRCVFTGSNYYQGGTKGG